MDFISITLIGGWIVSILIAYITAYLKTKSEFEKEYARLRLDVIMKQKHEYFFPFKFCADEFRRRIIHIQKILNREDFDNDKYENMIKRLKQNFKSKDLEWFFNDEIGSQGGYFITSTIYQNCMLFYWMKRIQSEQPFIPLDLGRVRERFLKFTILFVKKTDSFPPSMKENAIFMILSRTSKLLFHEIKEFLMAYMIQSVISCSTIQTEE